MEKDKMIEELSKDISHICDMQCEQRGCTNCTYYQFGDKCVAVLVSETLTDKGYRKIPEGAVVLTQEELAKHDEEVREETKREVLKKLNGFRFAMYDEDEEECEIASWTCGEDDVKQFAKEIGVEVEE